MKRPDDNRNSQAEQHCGDLVLWEWLLPPWVMVQHAPNLHSFPQNEVIGEYVK